LLNYIHELFVAGSGSVASTIGWGLICLVHYPHIQKKLRNEILNKSGKQLCLKSF